MDTLYVTGPLWPAADSTHKGPILRSFDVLFELSLNSLVSKDLRLRDAHVIWWWYLLDFIAWSPSRDIVIPSFSKHILAAVMIQEKKETTLTRWGLDKMAEIL